MGQEDVLVEVLINGKDMLQFYSTKENYKTLYEDRDALIDTVKTAFKEGVLYSANINVDDIHSVEFLSEVAEVAEVVEGQHIEQEVEEEETYHTYEIVEEQMENLTSSSIPEELIMDVGFSGADERLNLCPHCDYRTFNVGHFKIHMRQHTGEAPFQCDLCDYKSKQNSNLKRHMKQHLLGKDHFDCKLCNFSCTQEKVYKRHMILHSRTRPLRPCPFCDYFSTSLAHLTVHIRQHTGETPYHCGLCSYKTVQKSNLTRHLKKHRRGKTSKADKLRCCPHCIYRTPNPAHLLAHIRAAHTGETPYACNLCSYKSAQRSNLKRHLRKHSGERPYNCHLCNYSTAYPYVLKKHLENHPVVQMTRMTCDMCDYMTFSAIHFKKHIKTHSASPLYDCKICGFIALNSANLKVHLRKHASLKHFKCKFCHFRSASKVTLRKHQFNKHSGTPHTERKAAVSEEKNDQVEEVISEEHAEREDEEMGMHGEEEIVEEHEGEIDNSEPMYVEGPHYIEQMHEEEAVEVHITEVEEDKSQLELIEHEEEHGTEETVEVVVNEEDVVTTPMEEQQYTIIEEYDDGKGLRKLYRCVLCSYHTHDSEKLELHIRQHNREQIFRCKFCDFRAHSKANVRQHMRKQHIGNTKGIPSSDTESPKTKNISFLNKNQTEKLKEFKRLLQEGTKLVPQNVTHTRIQQEETLKRSSNTELDNISERTESVTEEINLEEDLNDSGINQIEDSPDKRHIYPTDGTTHIVYDNGETVSLNQLAEDSSVLIVEGGEGDQEYEVVGRYQFETVDDEKIPDAALVISCELCGHETRTVSELKAHIGTHTGETALSKSQSPKQSSTSYFKCNKCSFRAFRELDLSRHKALFHGESPPQRLPFVCGSCGYRSANKSEYQKHVETSHQISVKCKICELKLYSEDELKHHSRNHIGEEPFECYFCAYLTARKCHLRKHIKRRHNAAKGGKGPPYECYTCGYKTSQRNDFHNHITEHKAEVNNTYKCQVDSCRFLTLDKDVYKKHMMVHSVTSNKDTQDITDNSSKESITNDSRLTSEPSKTNKRVPLKEYGNLPESDRTKPPSSIKPGLPSLIPLNRKLVRDEDSNSPVKKKRKGLKSFNPEESLIDNRLARKFNFDTKNLATTPKRVDHGLGIDFVGEVYKGHGSLRKFVNFGDVIAKSDYEEAIVLTHPENEAQLKVIYNHFKELLSSIKKKGPGGKSSNFTIYFKEMEPREGQEEETIGNVDIDIFSSDDEEKISSLRDEESDMELYDEPSDDEPQPKQAPIPVEKPSNSRNGFKKVAPEIVIDLDGEDKVQLIQEKIRQQNEKRKELRKIKALNISREKKSNIFYDE